MSAPFPGRTSEKDSRTCLEQLMLNHSALDKTLRIGPSGHDSGVDFKGEFLLGLFNLVQGKQRGKSSHVLLPCQVLLEFVRL